MAEQQILISIIIPVKNGAFWLHETIRAILKQTLFNQTEIIVIDSGSTDSTLEILNNYPVQIVQIMPNEFNHGVTRNLGVSLAKGKYVVMTVQDAQPKDEFWLEQLLNGFEDDDVVAVCGKQVVPHVHNSNPVLWHRPISAPLKRIVQFTTESFKRLTPSELKDVCKIDNVTTMYRKDKLIELPFRKIFFGEDMQWAKEALGNGWKLVYTDFAVVNHHHTDHPAYVEKRTYSECFFNYVIFGYEYKAISFLVLMIRDLIVLLKEKNTPFFKKIFWFIYNIKIHLAENSAINKFNLDKVDDMLTLENKLFLRVGMQPPIGSNFFSHNQINHSV